MDYRWDFPQFDTAPSKDGLTDVVVTVHWRLTANDNGVEASIYGTVNLAEPDPGDFTPYQSITFDTTLAWVSGVLDVDGLKTNLADRINMARNPPVVPTVPPFN